MSKLSTAPKAIARRYARLFRAQATLPQLELERLVLKAAAELAASTGVETEAQILQQVCVDAVGYGHKLTHEEVNRFILAQHGLRQALDRLAALKTAP